MKEGSNFNTANPAPLGMVGFGFATLLLNLHAVGLFAHDAMILSVGLLLGGMLQLMVGIWEYKRNNMFGMVAFAAYGAFWLSLIFIMVFPLMGIGNVPEPTSLGFYHAIWAVFSFGLLMASLKANKASKLLFLCVTLLFSLLATADFTGMHGLKQIAGIEGIFTGALALYIALAELYKETYKKEILPLG
ncbi:MAG: acetate uptake transporter [Bacteroidales bacterium]